MCTLILLQQQVPGWPRVVGSNRDEHFARPSAPPALFAGGDEGEGFVAPQDLQAGGTWMGINARGLFVGVTNRRSSEPVPADGRSRGSLVRRLLGLPDVKSVAAALERCDGRYRPFHVVASDEGQALLGTLREAGGTVELEALPPGAHVVCNANGRDPASSKVRELQEQIGKIDWAAGLPSVRAALAELLSSHRHGLGSLEDACVHLSEYGTRSSAILGIGPRWHWWQAEGPPCQTKYQNYSRLLGSIQSQAPVS